MFFLFGESLVEEVKLSRNLIYEGKCEETSVDGMECVLGRPVSNKVWVEVGARCFITARLACVTLFNAVLRVCVWGSVRNR